jgi:oxygen-independent coproporphyrinogen-3 oxidase
MQPDRLSVYNYAHLPGRFKGQRMIRDADIPTPDVKLDILHHTIDKLTESGYVYIGMDHFALPGDELVTAQREKSMQRNFQGYSTHAACDLIGLGVSAIGSVGNAFIQNSPSTIEYEQLVGQGKLPVRRGLVRDNDDKIRAEIIQQLMCYDALHFADIEERFEIDFRSYFQQELTLLEPLIADGLLENKGTSIHITAKGRLLLRSIAMIFDRYLQQADQNRFSKAI